MITQDRQKDLSSEDELDRAVICVVGLGTVGLPLAQEFARRSRVIGFDIDQQKLAKLNLGSHNHRLELVRDPARIREADFVLIAVPTPLTEGNTPNLSYVEEACRTIGQNLKRGSTVILESTVYPGATEEVVKPILEGSGLRCGIDFCLACSPERVNPGDEEHTLGRTAKVVAGMDEATTALVARLYRRIVPQVYEVSAMRTAEAAKLVENVQRDVNIALVNELSLLFDALGLDSRKVLQAAATKWNFAPYTPGLVVGYCIPVSPHYLLHKAGESGFYARLIRLARDINDSMPQHVTEMTLEALSTRRGGADGARVLILGLTYKENIAEGRYSPVREMVERLQAARVEVLGYDPLVPDIQAEFSIPAVSALNALEGIDGIILAVAHDAFKQVTLDHLKRMSTAKTILIDVRGFFDRQEAIAKGFLYRSL